MEKSRKIVSLLVMMVLMLRPHLDSLCNDKAGREVVVPKEINNYSAQVP